MSRDRVLDPDRRQEDSLRFVLVIYTCRFGRIPGIRSLSSIVERTVSQEVIQIAPQDLTDLILNGVPEIARTASSSSCLKDMLLPLLVE